MASDYTPWKQCVEEGNSSGTQLPNVFDHKLCRKINLQEMNKLNGEKPHNALYIISIPKLGDAF